MEIKIKPKSMRNHHEINHVLCGVVCNVSKYCTIKYTKKMNQTSIIQNPGSQKKWSGLASLTVLRIISADFFI